MLQLGNGLGLGAEAGQLLGAGMYALEDHLQGDRAVQTLLACFIDDAHAAATELTQDLITSYPDLRSHARGNCSGGRLQHELLLM